MLVEGRYIVGCHTCEGWDHFTILKNKKKQFCVVVPVFSPNVIRCDGLQFADPRVDSDLLVF